MKTLVDLLNTPEARDAKKSLAYYDGEQAAEMTKSLNDTNSGRKDWRQKGIKPRFRNITRMIVEKSGLLFDDEPTLEVWNNKTIDQPATDALLSILEGANWVEFFKNQDVVTRLLRSSIVLLQRYEDKLILDTLHRGNCYIELDPITHEMTKLVYIVSETADETKLRVFTTNQIIDVTSRPNTADIEVSQPNPYGIIPAVVFHDTNLPRKGTWNTIPMDLVAINEMYNFHLIDSEYSAAWSKMKTLFTNAEIKGDGSIRTTTVQEYNQPLPRQSVVDSAAIIAGPNTVVQIDAGSQNPFVEYLGPEVNLQPIDEMFGRWIKDYAADWSVNVKAGAGTASSGFQLVVEEIDNLQLRKSRSKYVQAGFRQLYQVIRTIFGLTSTGDLFLTFQEPKLPINELEDERTWSERISNNRASIIDYLITKHKLSREEALNKAQEIQADNQSLTTTAPVTKARQAA